jgi:hypothetical protein
MKLSLILLAFTIMVCSPSWAQDESCSAVLSTSASSLTFLGEQKDTRESPCVSAAIKRLGQARDVNAIHVLVSYLDFVDPGTSPRPDGFSDVRPVYPAVGALFLIGKSSTRELLATIQRGDSPIIRQNATKAYQAVYRDDLASGIRLLRNEELAANLPDGQRRFQKVQKMLIDDCRGRGEEERQACNAAASR